MIMVMAGDHSLGACSVAGVATAFAERGQRIGLIWLDAHADLNTPASSLSGNVHGMPVAHLLGEGDEAMRSLANPSPAMLDANLVYIGLRDLDAAEVDSITAKGILAFTMRDIDERGLVTVMREAIARASNGTTGIYVSCDADWVDPSEAPGDWYTGQRRRDLSRGTFGYGDVVRLGEDGGHGYRRDQSGAGSRDQDGRVDGGVGGERTRETHVVMVSHAT